MFFEFFRENCIICKADWDLICKSCQKNIELHPEICPVCYKYSKDFKVCIDCKENSFLDGVIIGFRYNFYIKRLLLAFKYFNKYRVWEFFVDKLKYILLANESIILDNTIFTYVPIHWIKKVFIRWYNQSEKIAKKLANNFGLQIISFCKKKKYTYSQTKLTRRSRFKNVVNSFENIYFNNFKENTIIIIDDVFTTGATLNEIAKCIKKQFPDKKIWWLTITRYW